MRLAAAMVPWSVTGTRPVAPLARGSARASSARTVRTRSGYALFNEAGRYVGMVAGLAGRPAFGRGAETVLLRRENWE